MNRTSLIAAAVILAVASGAVVGTAHARGGPGEFGGMRGGPFGPGFMQQLDFSELDADGSGAITVEDLQAAAQTRFADADANGDGQLNEAEIAARIKARIEERGLEPRRRGGVEWTPAMDERQIAWMAEGMIIRMDDDGNGTVSAEEVTPDPDRLSRMIDRFDTSGDDAVSAEEFEEAKAAIAERGKGRWGKRHGRGNN
ncbi:MAG: EF-hand domain-containing protein [Rhodobacter sp.]|nr:EF-hand domain-containing protein [Rhodobacter sp.]